MGFFIRLLRGVRDLSISTKLIAIISLLVLVSLLLLSAIVVGIFQEDMRSMVALLNSRTGKVLAEKLEGELERLTKTLNLALTLKKDKSSASLIRKLFQEEKFILAVADSHGIFWQAEDNSLDAKLLEKSYKELHQIWKKGSSQNLFNLSASVDYPLWGYVHEREKDRLYVLLVAENLRVSFILDMQMIVEKNSLYSVMLYNKKGELLLHSDAEIMQKGDLTPPAVIEKIKRMPARSGVLRFDDQGVAHYGAFQKFWKDELILISSVREEVAFEGVRIARWRSLLVALFIITLSVLFVYYFARTLSVPIKDLAHAAQEIRHGNYDIPIEVKSKDEIGELSQAFLEMKVGLAEREKLKGALNKFVNPEIARMVLQRDLSLGGEIREVSVLFSDIRSFTALTEHMDPRLVVDFLNEYLSIMVNIIHRRSGFVDKFIGDAIMAVWGAPISYGNDAKNAVLCALEMREALLHLNEKRKAVELPPISIGIGIASGKVLAGQIGSQDRLEYTVVGDTVNLASRLQSLNKAFGSDILISKSTYELVHDFFRTQPLEKILIRGKSEPQHIYAVLGLKSDPNAPRSLEELQKLIDTKPLGKLKKARHA
ncbi:MAG: HAMP domain-containing protein [Leptospiraceae bacterium]|nr:HAMP domain-containing protein [Leptospiraceae bacterium]MDW8306924.1 adenylate/guanylate cyclase domain-containing protein [Leptospiraceae bacterium]